MRTHVLFLVSSFALSDPAWAENAADGPGFDPITVVATGLRTRVSDTGQPITIIGLDEIESVQGPDLVRVLRRLPGVAISRNGGAGMFTGVRVRGAASEQLLVLVDGVKVNDVAAPGRGFDFGNLLGGDVERIELLRGPNSVIWGSDAMGGVMNLATRVPQGIVASAEYGSGATVYTTLGGGIATERLEAGLTGSFYDARGFSASANGTEPDGFRQWQLTAHARYGLADGLALIANARYADGRAEQDGYEWSPPFAFVDTDDVQDTREWSGRIGAEYSGGGLTLRAGYSLADTQRRYSGESYGGFPYETKGRAERAEMFGRYDFADAFSLDFGVDRERSRFEDSGGNQTTHLTSGHAQFGWQGSLATVAAGMRYDDHSRFGGEWTFGANGVVRLTDDLRLRASYGEGFKVPTLYQLYSFFGNLDLAPERSKGYDIGLEKGARDGTVFAALSLFRRDSRDLIDFDLVNAVYYNIGKARSEGMELELAVRPSDGLRAGIVYSYVKATDRTPDGFYEGNDLNRRPRHALTASLDWDSPVGLTLGADVRLVGDSFDDRSNLTRMDGYETLDLRGALPLGESAEVFGRVENLFDAAYQTVAGYSTGGRAAYVGARLRL